MGRPEKRNGPEPCDNRRFGLVAALFGLLTIAFLVCMVVLAGRRQTYVADNIAQLVSGLVAMAMCAPRRGAASNAGRGGLLLPAPFWSPYVGNALWCYYNIISSGGVVRSSWRVMSAAPCPSLAYRGVDLAGGSGLPPPAGGGPRQPADHDGDVLHGLDTRAKPGVPAHFGRISAVEMFNLGLPACDLWSRRW